MKKQFDVLNMSPEEIQKEVDQLGGAAYRGKQVFKWLYRGVDKFDMMSDLPDELRKKLDEELYITRLEKIKKSTSIDNVTSKYLFLLQDNNIIESVVMKYRYGHTVCLSTQVGCKMGCRFCASSLDGFIRNLSTGEMVAQILAIEGDLNATRNERVINNIVLMGSGEPLDNYENTVKFLKLINHPLGFNFSFRNITLSTCGIIPKINRLAQEKLPITLSVSLHAPSDEKRKEIMPAASVYSISDLLKSCRDYYDLTGRRVTFEYALIRSFNDSPKDADMLADKIQGFACHVNVIPVNEVKGKQYQRSDENATKKFIQILKNRNVSVTRRRELGLDINGACGQLRRGYTQKGQGIST